MPLIVHKYGGTSMGSPERIRNVARRVAKWARAGHQIVVVPSAMSGETNRLLGLAAELAPARATSDYHRELDMLAATGEQASSALLAIALQAEGMPSVSYAGWQVPVRTDSSHTKARIESIDDHRVQGDLDAGRVVIVTGFQGIDELGNITTLGRGGSDTSAVAIAAAMGAAECLIYTDVDGVYTTDPRVVPAARRLGTVSFEEMLEMASLGSKVLQIRSVEFAGKYKVPMRVLSSFTPWDIDLAEEMQSGTLITFEEDEKMEQAVVSGIAFNRGEAKVSVLGVPDTPGMAYRILGPVADANIEVDVIIQNISKDGKADFSFTVSQSDYPYRGSAARHRGARAGCAGSGRRPQYLQGQHRRHRHAQPRRRGQQDVPRAERRRHQHPDDLHLRDQNLRRDRRKVPGTGRARPAHRLRPGPGNRLIPPRCLPEGALSSGIIAGLET
jgi:aspartate kinase